MPNPDDIISSNLAKYQDILELSFSRFLSERGASGKTQKNYCSDISHFLGWTVLTIQSRNVPIPATHTELIGLMIGYPVDTYVRNIVTAGTTILFSNGAARADVITIPDGNDLDRVIRTLMVNGAEVILGGNDGTSVVGTYPVMPAYAFIVHPRTMFTLQNLSGYKDASQYRGAGPNEYGRYKSLAIFVATDPSSLGIGAPSVANSGGASRAVTHTGGTADVYQSLAIGKHAYHQVRLTGKSTSMHVKPVGSAGTADPLDQLSTIGAKHTGAGLITNQLWLASLEHAVEL